MNMFDLKIHVVLDIFLLIAKTKYRFQNLLSSSMGMRSETTNLNK